MAQLSFKREGRRGLEQAEKPQAEISAAASITDIPYSSVNVTLFCQLQKAAEDTKIVSGESPVALMSGNTLQVLKAAVPQGSARPVLSPKAECGSPAGWG